jgi:hypothetical protein
MGGTSGRYVTPYSLMARYISGSSYLNLKSTTMVALRY